MQTCDVHRDFTINDNASLVPEPASFMLFGLGLALIPALRKRSTRN